MSESLHFHLPVHVRHIRSRIHIRGHGHDDGGVRGHVLHSISGRDDHVLHSIHGRDGGDVHGHVHVRHIHKHNVLHVFRASLHLLIDS